MVKNREKFKNITFLIDSCVANLEFLTEFMGNSFEMVLLYHVTNLFTLFKGAHQLTATVNSRKGQNRPEKRIYYTED